VLREHQLTASMNLGSVIPTQSHALRFAWDNYKNIPICRKALELSTWTPYETSMLWHKGFNMDSEGNLNIRLNNFLGNPIQDLEQLKEKAKQGCLFSQKTLTECIRRKLNGNRIIKQNT
jgi:hypothetical protein